MSKAYRPQFQDGKTGTQAAFTSGYNPVHLAGIEPGVEMPVCNSEAGNSSFPLQ